MDLGAFQVDAFQPSGFQVPVVAPVHLPGGGVAHRRVLTGAIEQTTEPFQQRAVAVVEDVAELVGALLGAR